MIRAANETDSLTEQEKARLLYRAAETIRGYRELVAYSETPANDVGQGDIVFELNAMASAVDLFPPERISAALLKSVTNIALRGPVPVLTSWQLYAVIASGAAGVARKRAEVKMMDGSTPLLR